MAKICDAACGLRFLADNSLEEYRAESLLTKEPETITWIDSELRAGEIFLDVGANVGIYSLYAALRHPDSTTYAVEPFLRNFVRLCENVQLNGLGRIVPLFLAFSDRTGVESLFVRDERTGGSGSQLGHSKDEHGNSFQAVWKQETLVFTVDDFFAAFGIPVPQHIKIDVDGNEEKIVRGMSSTLSAKTLRSLLVELNLASDNTGPLIQTIESYGFTRENRYNALSEHSRNRRRTSATNVAENLIFTRCE